MFSDRLSLKSLLLTLKRRWGFALVGFVVAYVIGTGASYVVIGSLTGDGLQFIEGSGSGFEWAMEAATVSMIFDDAREAMRMGNPVKGLLRYFDVMAKCSGTRVIVTLLLFLADAFLFYLVLPITGALCAATFFGRNGPTLTGS